MSANFKSLEEIANFYSRSKSAVHKWTKHDSWPCKGKNYSKARIDKFCRRWIDKVDAPQSSSHATDDPDFDSRPLEELIQSLPPERRVKAMFALEKMASEKLDREMKLGGFLKKEDVERGRVERVVAVKAELVNARLLALKMEGKALPEREQILDEWARGVCRKFAGADG